MKLINKLTTRNLLNDAERTLQKTLKDQDSIVKESGTFILNDNPEECYLRNMARTERIKSIGHFICVGFSISATVYGVSP